MENKQVLSYTVPKTGVCTMYIVHAYIIGY